MRIAGGSDSAVHGWRELERGVWLAGTTACVWLEGATARRMANGN
ncbi:hypothetical protein ACX93W_17415 [Paenibacillus sp. CAU 1782]